MFMDSLGHGGDIDHLQRSRVTLMFPSLGRKPKHGDSLSTECYERRIVMKCGSINPITLCTLSNPEILPLLIPSSIVLLSLDQSIHSLRRQHIRSPLESLYLNQIQSWYELNHMYLNIHRFNQLWFQAMLKFVDQAVLQSTTHFHHSHLNQIHT
jgi:hypothetical protein